MDWQSLAQGGGALTAFGNAIGANAANSLWGGLVSGNWGGTSKERKNIITDTRKLRKTAYQDMVFSLEEAGLNPILAVGASPGTASAQQVGQQWVPGNPGFASAAAANRQAKVAEDKAPSEIKGNEATAGLREIERTATQLGIPSLLQRFEMNQATIDETRSRTALQGQQRELARLQGLLAIADTKVKGASADQIRKQISEIEQRMDEISRYGLPGQTLGGYVRRRGEEQIGIFKDAWDPMRPFHQIGDAATSAWDWYKENSGEPPRRN